MASTDLSDSGKEQRANETHERRTQDNKSRPSFRLRLQSGLVIPAHPLALNARRELDERRQTGLTRYYCDAGAGGLAVGVHTTQFAIREAGLYRTVLQLAAEESRRPSHDPARAEAVDPVLVAGVVGKTPQAVTEAGVAVSLGYDAALLSLGGEHWSRQSDSALLQHIRTVGEIIPIFGFYLQPAVGGRVLSYRFWRELAEDFSVVAIKVAPFNRYQTLDVVRAVVESGRDDIALYTGNDDNIVFDLLTPFVLDSGGREVRRWFAGGLLGQWAVGTGKAVDLLEEIKKVRTADNIPARLLSTAAQLTDANAAIFDPANNFAGCIPGIHEVLRHGGLLDGIWCLDPREKLSDGQEQQIRRVMRLYPDLFDAPLDNQGIA